MTSGDMPRSTVRIRLANRACALALEPRRAAAPATHPLVPTLLAHAAPGPAGSDTRIIVCTLPEARALLDHFSGLTDSLAGLGDPDAAVSAAARDAVRRALVAAGA